MAPCPAATQPTLQPSKQILRHIARRHNLYGQTAAERARVDEASLLPVLLGLSWSGEAGSCGSNASHLQLLRGFERVRLPKHCLVQVIEGADDLASQFFLKGVMNKASLVMSQMARPILSHTAHRFCMYWVCDGTCSPAAPCCQTRCCARCSLHPSCLTCQPQDGPAAKENYFTQHWLPQSARASNTRGAHAHFLSRLLSESSSGWFVESGMTVAGAGTGAVYTASAACTAV